MEKNAKKQIPLRISAKLYEELCAWAEDEFRSLNGQIEYLLNESLKRRKGIKEKKIEKCPEALSGFSHCFCCAFCLVMV